jgi:glycerol-3-phosphate dehydrogenase
MAERVVDTVAPILKRTLPPSPSADQKLPGGDLDGARDLAAYAASPAVRTALASVPPDTAARLVASYGSDALDVVRRSDGPDALATFGAEIPLCAAEVQYAVRHEMAQTLVDVLERRSRLSYFATEAARAAAPRVADIAGRELGWDDRRIAHEVDTFTRQCDARLAWRNH